MLPLKPHNINATQILLEREYGASESYIQRRLQMHSPFVDRLEQETVLKAHEGCVNCLEWSSDGRILASGSDDLQLILWEPFSKRKIFSMRTKHLGNMFSVKFLPRHNDAVIATGAADKYIYVVDLHRQNETLLSCHCHAARVKRLATAPDSPHIFWSAGEDGTIMQLDMREQHRCRAEDNAVRLLHLQQQLDTSAEAKCLAINPLRTEYLAVGANDPYARIYDRRLIKPISSFLGGSGGSASANAEQQLINGRYAYPNTSTGAPHNIPRDCVSYFCPGHVNKVTSRFTEHESRAITYLAFNSTGTELLVNMGGEHIYLYDMWQAAQPVFLDLPEYVPNKETVIVETVTDSVPDTAAKPEESQKTSEEEPPHRRKLPEHIETYKKMGNEFLENEKYLRAIEQYSEAIALAPDCAVLYLNRATAYMRRQWFGDIYAAMRDCHEALRLDPSYIKAHFRLARALLELGRSKEADECLKELINRFPSYGNNHGVMMLAKDIKENRNTKPNNSGYFSVELSDDEFHLRSKAKDYKKRFVGHCNTTTDIKEANFFGQDNRIIVAGSDDGNFYLWERETGKIRAVYKADSAIVNCVQPHPSICALATSGIDHDIKIWSPVAESSEKRPNLVSYIDKCVTDNQTDMKTDIFDLNPRNAFCLNG